MVFFFGWYNFFFQVTLHLLRWKWQNRTSPLRLSEVSLNWRPNSLSWEVLKALQILQGTLQLAGPGSFIYKMHILFLPVRSAASLELLCSGINFPLWWSHNAGFNPALSPCHSWNIPQCSWDNIRNLDIWADFFPGQLNISCCRNLRETVESLA